ncbi:Multidrug resistance outer membrane protein MdtP precursor [Legionella massiliensis]|uniref:Multidrug resistance outer membrane protein MdtP n=1 Tax=Legionella massiliensis TaxID=1034943 RepID=A0A078L4U6_9GAMM|nr:efflux transporter outer membrane subunit [Legionella massiliensis]CDZ78913.1 Multidrug resistance outer membrane protein MdtP precursor [Legionella massiliensis]CEE14651.1 Multidrug resistance outer membrane protein MdtP precursor [Legionella massiliensis]
MIFWNNIQRYSCFVICFITLSGCVNYIGIHSNKKIASPKQFQTAKSLPKQNGHWPNSDWAKQFADPQLVVLINEALANNPSLQAAQARIDQARALVQAQRASLFPHLDAQGSVTRTRLSSKGFLPPPLNNAIFTQTGFLTDLRYTLDIWGKNLSSLRQAISEANASEAANQEARLAIATSVASTYNELAYYYDLSDVLKRTVSQRGALDKITGVRLRTGLDTKVQLYQSRNTTATARTQLANVEGQILLTKQQLGTLLGAGPDRGLSIRRPRLGLVQTPALPANLPLNLLGRRPDIVGARWRVEAACQGISHAKALFYPNIDLLAGVGYLSLHLAELTTRANAEFVGPAIRLPLFDGGALRAQLRNQYAQYEEAVANYNDTLNNALSDVATQLTNIKSIDRQLGVEREALDSARHAYDLARYQYRVGLASQLVVLNAETSYLSEQQTRLNLILDRRNRQVALIYALGGGFNSCCTPPVKDSK